LTLLKDEDRSNFPAELQKGCGLELLPISNFTIRSATGAVKRVIGEGDPLLL